MSSLIHLANCFRDRRFIYNTDLLHVLKFVLIGIFLMSASMSPGFACPNNLGTSKAKDFTSAHHESCKEYNLSEYNPNAIFENHDSYFVKRLNGLRWSLMIKERLGYQIGVLEDTDGTIFDISHLLMVSFSSSPEICLIRNEYKINWLKRSFAQSFPDFFGMKRNADRYCRAKAYVNTSTQKIVLLFNALENMEFSKKYNLPTLFAKSERYSPISAQVGWVEIVGTNLTFEDFERKSRIRAMELLR